MLDSCSSLPPQVFCSLTQYLNNRSYFQIPSAHNLIFWSWKIFQVEKTAPNLSEPPLAAFGDSGLLPLLSSTRRLLLRTPLIPEATRQALRCFLIYSMPRNPKVGLKCSCVWLSEGMCVCTCVHMCVVSLNRKATIKVWKLTFLWQAAISLSGRPSQSNSVNSVWWTFSHFKLKA